MCPALLLRPANKAARLEKTRSCLGFASCPVSRKNSLASEDDSLFIFRREASPRALLTAAEREALYAEGGNEATLFGSNGVSSDSAAPELRKLIDE
jgi:hypothetical protein